MKMLWIDPERNYGFEELKDFDGIIIGGSAGFCKSELDSLVSEARKTGTKVYFFPNNASLMSDRVDAVLFMQLLNSRSAYWSSEVLALGAPLIKSLSLKVIPSALIVFKPGRLASWIADVKPIDVSDHRLAIMHALAAKYLGAELLFLERKGGVPKELVQKIKKETGLKIAAVGPDLEGIADWAVIRK